MPSTLVGVVLGDADLLRHVQWDFLQAVLVGHLLDERHDEVEARSERAVVAAEPLDHPGGLLRHDLDRLDDEDERDDDDDDGDFHGGGFQSKSKGRAEQGRFRDDPPAR